jgi:flavin prenyltransferase
MRFVVAITGASGSAYGVRLLQELPGEKILVVSKTAEQIIPYETGLSVDEVRSLADIVLDDSDLFATISSGSYRYDAMIVAPCSESSVAKFANGIADTLISRAVSVCIKENRKLVLLIRETPKSAIMLENELKLARCGVVIMDANPGFWNGPETADDIIDFLVGRCLDQVGVDNDLVSRWNGA